MSVQKMGVIVPGIVFSTILLLVGCKSLTSPTLVKANDDYVNKFQAVSNKQLLVNLARLADDEPASYIQIGTFSAAYTYGATAGTPNPNYMGGFGGGKAATTTVSLGTTLGLSYSETPTFSFTPLSGDAVTKALFTPVPKNVFSLILATWTTDCAIRTLVQSMKIVPPEPRTKTSDEAVLFVPGLDTWTWAEKDSSPNQNDSAHGDSQMSYTATGLPPDVAIDSLGHITGKPKELGEWTATVCASYNITILPPPATGTAENHGTTGYVNTNYCYTRAYSAKNPPSYTATGLPTGLKIDASTGMVSGVPTTSGVGTVKISTPLHFTNLPPASKPTSGVAAILVPNPTIATRDHEYSYSSPFFKNLPEVYTISGLPPGLKLESGAITGNPTKSGTSIVSIGADKTPTTVFNITVADPERPPPPLFAEQPNDQTCSLGQRAIFTVSMATESINGQPPECVNYQWEASSDSGKTWNPLADGADKEDSSDPHNPAMYSGTTTSQLSVVRVTEKLNLRRFRCKVTEKETAPVVITNDPKDQSYPLFLALTYEILCAHREHLIPAPFPSDFEKKLQEKAESESESTAITMGNIKLADVISAESDPDNYTIEDSTPKADASADPNPKNGQTYKVYKKPPTTDDTSVLSLPNPEMLKSEFLLRWIQRRGERIEWSLRSFDTILYFIAQEDHRFGSMTDAFTSDAILDMKMRRERAFGEIKGTPSILYFHDSLDLTGEKTHKSASASGALWKTSVTNSITRGIQKTVLETEPPFEVPHLQFPEEILPPKYEIRVDVYRPTTDKESHGAYAELMLSDGEGSVENFTARPTLRLTNYNPDKELKLVEMPHKLGGKTTVFEVGDIANEVAHSPDNIIPSMPNTTEFTLLSYLFDQASIDSSKLPVQQLIEVR